MRDVMRRINAAIDQTLQGQTLKDLVVAEEQDRRQGVHRAGSRPDAGGSATTVECGDGE